MKKIDFKRVVKMLGDEMHNEDIEILFDGVDLRKKPNKQITDFMYNCLKVENESEVQWIFRSFPRVELKRINAIMKSKTESTFQKRVFKFIDKFFEQRFGYFMNKEKINFFNEFLTDKKDYFKA